MDQMFTGPLLDIAAWTVVLTAYGTGAGLVVLGIILLRRKPARHRASALFRALAILSLVCGIGLAAAMTAMVLRSGGA